MSQERHQAGLAWLIRRYLGLTLAIILLTTGAGVAVASALARSSPFEATALVIASDLQIRPEQLPRFGESVFASGTVASEVAQDLGLPEDYRTLVPDVIEVDPVAESISFLVRGRADAPVSAARLADAAAVAFVDQLNRAGAGVGTFSLQDTARPPLERGARGPGPVLGGLVSFIAGAILALVAVWSLYNLRRPVVSGPEAARIAGVRLLASVRIRRGSRQPTSPAGVRRLARELLALPADVVALVGTRHSRSARAELASGLSAIPEVAERRVVLPSTDDLTTGLNDRRVTVVLLVEEGTPAAHVDQVLADLLDDEIAGVVFVTWRRRRGADAETPPRAVALASRPAPAPPPRRFGRTRAPAALDRGSPTSGRPSGAKRGRGDEQAVDPASATPPFGAG